MVQVGCIGPCYLEPLVDIQLPGKPRVSYSNVNEKTLATILKSHLLEEKPYPKLAVGRFGNGPAYGEIPSFWELPMLKGQVRVVLRNCGMIDPEQIDDYLAVDGYAGFVKALTAIARRGDRCSAAGRPAGQGRCRFSYAIRNGHFAGMLPGIRNI